MRDTSKYVVSVVGAGALVASVLTNALASRPAPHIAQAGRNETVTGSLTVNGVIHAKKNETIYGNFYTKGKAEIYKGLLIRANGLTVTSGGGKFDSLDVSGALHAQSGAIDQNLNVTGNVQAANLSASSLTVSGATTMSGKLTASGGIDAGAGGLTTTGALNAGAATVASLTDTGALVANGLTATGTVNFSNATVTGLNLSNIVGTGNLNLQHLALGTPTASSAPLTLAANGQTTTLSVDAAGNVQVPTLATVGNVNVGGSVLINGTGGLQTSLITSAPATAGSSTLTPLAIKGSTITLTGDTTLAGALTATGASTFNGTTTVSGNNDLVLPTAGSGSTATAAHIVGGPDIDGTTTINVGVANTGPTATTPATQTVTFTRAYSTKPTVVVTAASDPSGNGNPAPRVWVTPVQSTGGSYTGFTINYILPSAAQAANNYSVQYNYVVIG